MLRVTVVYKPNPKQYFRSIEELYKTRFNALMAVASRHIYNKDYAVDAVHDALAKSVEYLKKHPKMNLREQIVHYQVIKACKRLNKYSREIPFGDTRDMESL